MVDPDDMQVSLQALDQMIDSWSNDRLMIYTISPYVFNTVGGQQTYTLGPGGDWNIDRPMEIEEAYVRWNTGTPQAVDIPVGLLTDAEYASIGVKQTPSAFPFLIYDNGDYPLRTIFTFPVPNQTTEIVLWLRQPLIDVTNLDGQVMYPKGYERAFRFNLACEVAAEFMKEIPSRVELVAEASKADIARLNFNPRYAAGDGGLNGGKKTWNYVTGNFGPAGHW